MTNCMRIRVASVHCARELPVQRSDWPMIMTIRVAQDQPTYVVSAFAGYCAARATKF